MILLDTNVVSEVMRRAPIPKVVTWLNNANSNELYLSSISIAEIAYGLQVLPEGKRRQEIATRFVQFLEGGFNFRTLAFDDRAAFAYGDLMATTRALGRPMSMPDGQIAAIAKSQGMSLATRNVNDFEATGLTLINPWMQ